MTRASRLRKPSPVESALVAKRKLRRKSGNKRTPSAHHASKLEQQLEADGVEIYDITDTLSISNAHWTKIEEYPHYSVASIAVRHVNGHIDAGIVRSDRTGDLLAQCVYGSTKKVIIESNRDVQRLIIDTLVGKKPGDGYTIDHMNRVNMYNLASNLRASQCSI
jgi:hypothetical protein